MFDPSKYRITESADYEVLDSTADTIFIDADQTIPWTITVASPGTKKAMRAAKKRSDLRQRDAVSVLKGKKSALDDDAEVKLRADFLMEVVEGTNATDLTYEGKTGMDALRAIFLDPFMAHIANGLENFHGNLGNFNAASANP